MILAFDAGQWLNLGINFILFIMMIALVLRVIKYKADIPYILMAVICAAVGNILFSILAAFNIFAQIIGYSLVIMAFLFLYMHYVYLSSDRMKLSIYSIIVSVTLFCVLSTIQLVGYFGRLDAGGYFDQPEMHTFIWGETMLYFQDWTYMSGAIISLVAISLCFWMMKENYQKTRHKEVLIELIGIIFLGIYRLVFFIRDVFKIEFGYFYMSLIGLIFAFLGLTTIMLNYIINPKYLYSIPFPIHSFMIYDNAGLLMYSRHMQIKEMNGDVNRDVLITSAFTAINSLIKHNLGEDGELKRIDAVGFSIYFVNLPQNSGRLGVISKGRTKFFARSLKRFASEFPEEIITSFMKTHQAPENIAIDELIQKAFPYLVFAKH